MTVIPTVNDPDWMRFFEACERLRRIESVPIPLDQTRESHDRFMGQMREAVNYKLPENEDSR